MEETNKFLVRMPVVLHARMLSDLGKRRAAGEPKLSMNDWLLEATREKLDGPAEIPYEPFAPKATIYKERALGPTAGGNGGVKPSPQELAARLGIKTGKNIYEVEPRLDPDSGFKPGTLVSPLGQQPAVGASENHTPSRNWVKFYQEMNEMEPAEARYEFDKAIKEAGVKLPPGFANRPQNKQISWLQFNG